LVLRYLIKTLGERNPPISSSSSPPACLLSWFA
jgi:hypothetical protein